MKEIVIKVSNKQARMWNHYLGRKWKGRKKLEVKCKLTLLEAVAEEARKEVIETQNTKPAY